jgi:hypothetical protein
MDVSRYTALHRFSNSSKQGDMTMTATTPNEGTPTAGLSDERKQTVTDLAARIKASDAAYDAARQRVHQAEQDVAAASQELRDACRLLRDVLLSVGIDEDVMILLTPEFSDGHPF